MGSKAALAGADLLQGGLLREQAYAELKSRILNGQLARTFLSTRGLAKQLEMSLSPVRSAVERLESEGLLSIGPQRGLVVTELTAGEIIDQFEIREALESLVVRKLAGRLSAVQIAELKANLATYRASFAARDLEAFIARDSEFHLLLAEFAGNADIDRMLRQLRDRIFRVVRRVIEHSPQRMRKSIGEHRQIVASLESGDAEQAVDLMVRHLQSGLKALLPGDKPSEPGSRREDKT